LAAAAQRLAKAKDFAEAKAAYGQVKAAAAGQASEGAKPSWNVKVASLGQLMKQVNVTNTQMRRGLRRLDRLGDESARHAAVLAVIAQASMIDTHEVKNPADLGKWYQWCADMRTAAAAVNAAAKAKDQKATEAAVARLQRSCDDCHAVFQHE
jgi:hypothetical protein